MTRESVVRRVEREAGTMRCLGRCKRIFAFVCMLSLLGLSAASAGSLKLRQFDASRAPKIDIVAEMDQRDAPPEVDARELKADQATPAGSTESVPLIPAASLLRAKEYVYQRPIGNIFLTFAGSSADIATLANSHDFTAAVTEAFKDVQPKAVRIYVLDGVRNKLVICPTPREAAEAMLAQAKQFSAERPDGFFSKSWDTIKSIVKTRPYIAVDDAAGSVREFAARDPDAKGSIANALVVFWANGPEDDIKRVDAAQFQKDGFIVTMGEIVSCSDFAIERAQPFCVGTGGAFLSRRDLRLPKGQVNYQRVITTALKDFEVQIGDKFLLTASTRNAEMVDKCYFEISLPGQSVRNTLGCTRRDLSVPKEAADRERKKRDEQIGALKKEFDDKLARQDFGTAHDLVCSLAKDHAAEELQKCDIDPLAMKGTLSAKWQDHVLTLGDKGGDAAALRELDALNETKLISSEDYGRLTEDVYFRAGIWAVSEGKDQNRAMALLTKWRELARRSGSYGRQAPRAATVALQMARYLATDVGKDASFAAEINELGRIDPATSRGEKALPLLSGWICRNQEKYDISARLALIDDWGLIKLALPKDSSKSEPARRFFALATADAEARTHLLLLRSESIAKSAPAPGYVSLNRALVLAEPLAVALKAAAALQADATVIEELLNKATAGLNDREATFYRAGEGLAAQYLLTDDPVKMLSVRQEDLGFGIRIDRAFARRLHGGGRAGIFEGSEGERPTYVLLVPIGAEGFVRIAFSDRTAPAVQREFKTAKTQAAGKSKEEAMSICLNILDVRDAELAGHLGAELLGQLINHVGIGDFLRGGGNASLRDFYTAIPQGVRGFVLLDKLTAQDSGLVREPGSSVQFPTEMPADVKVGRRISGAAFALWEDPYFEIGIPVRDKGERRVSGILRVGLKSIPR